MTPGENIDLQRFADPPKSAKSQMRRANSGATFWDGASLPLRHGGMEATVNIRFYETFAILAKLGNFSKTAEQMNATQPTINGRISALEESLGTKLYVKGSKPFELTLQGKAVLQYAKKIVALEAELEQLLARREFNDTLRIGALEIVTMSWLPQFIRKVQERHPGLSMEIIAGTVSELIPRLKSNTIDLAFAFNTVAEPSLVHKPLCTFAMCWIANPKYFPTETEMDVHQLFEYPIFMATPRSSAYPYLRDYFAEHAMQDIFLETQQIKIDCAASVPTALNIVRNGLGVMAVPTALVMDEVVRGAHLARLPVRQHLPNVSVTASFKYAMRTPLLDDIVDIAGECAREFARSSAEGVVWA